MSSSRLSRLTKDFVRVSKLVEIKFEAKGAEVFFNTAEWTETGEASRLVVLLRLNSRGMKTRADTRDEDVDGEVVRGK